jgi:hypothetical protein
MFRQSRKAREIQLVAQAHMEAEDRLQRAYYQLDQLWWLPEVKRDRCEDGKESGLVCPGIDRAPGTRIPTNPRISKPHLAGGI